MTRDMHFNLFARYIFSCNARPGAHTAVTVSRRTFRVLHILLGKYAFHYAEDRLDPAGDAYCTRYMLLKIVKGVYVE